MTAASQPRPSDKWIPWYIVLLFVVFSSVLGTFAYIAVTTHTGTVTDGAYQKGLAYNSVIEKADAQDAFGYRGILALEDNAVVFTLADRAGAPVDVSAASVWFFRPTNVKGDRRADMEAAGEGRFIYKGAVAQGLWEIRIRAATPKGPYQYTKRMVFE